MKLVEVLQDNRSVLIEKWVAYTLETYKSAEFFRKQPNSFANPVGGTIRSALQEILTLLLAGEEVARFSEPLAAIMHLRSVQEFSPSQAVAPLNAIKHIARDVLGTAERANGAADELYDFEFAVDLLVLAAFDRYMECREKIYRIRLHEIKSGNHVLTDGKCPSKVVGTIQKK